MSTLKVLAGSCALAIASTLLAPVSAAAADADRASVARSVEREAREATSRKKPNFDKALGAHLGPGISEVLSDEIIAVLNETAGPTLPQDTHALRYLDDGAIYALDASGQSIKKISDASFGVSASEQGEPMFYAAAVLHPEVKRIIGACLGFSWQGGLPFEAFIQSIATPKNAVKFVVRRLGVWGAVACAGGIVWEYI